MFWSWGKIFLLLLLGAGLFWLTLSTSRRPPELSLVPSLFASSLARLQSLQGAASFEVQRPPESKARVDFQGDFLLTNLGELELKGFLNLKNRQADNDLSLTAELALVKGVSYFRLSSLSLPSGLPFLLNIQANWYRLGQEGEGGERFLGREKTLAWDETKEKKLRESFNLLPLFRAEKYLGKETVAGTVSHHFLIDLEEENLLLWLKGWAELAEEELDEVSLRPLIQEIGEREIELSLSSRDFHPTKLLIAPRAEGGEESRLGGLELIVSGYNKPVRVEAPRVVREWSDLSWWKSLWPSR